mgnify:CR=1 FL=1
MNITDFLVSIRRINKMHESMLKEICEEYELSNSNIIFSTIIRPAYSINV